MIGLPPPSAMPTRPLTKKMPPCRSSHSEDLSSLPAASRRRLIRASRSLLRRSTLAAVSFAEAKVTSVSRSGPPASADLVWEAVYWLTRSAALTVLGFGTSSTTARTRPRPSAAGPGVERPGRRRSSAVSWR